MPTTTARPPDAPSRLPAARVVARAFGSEAVYRRVVERLRRRGVSEADVERHNLVYAALAEGDSEKAAATVSRIGDEVLRAQMGDRIASFHESFVSSEPLASESLA